MIQLPKTKRDSAELAKLCLCRPVCKSRHREWKGQIQNASAELLLERKPKPECFRRWPTKVFPNSPCPLLGRTRRIAVKVRNTLEKHDMVRICQAPVDDQVDTPYLKLAEIARQLGAWKQVRARCAFCTCPGACCSCNKHTYMPRDAERATSRRSDMRQFDKRVKTECVVADYLTCILSVFFCCQCLPPLPMSTSTSVISPSIVGDKPIIDPERAGSGEPQPPQCVSIDFTAQPQDTDETATRCNQFWEMLKSQPDLEGIMVTSEKSQFPSEKECIPVHKNGSGKSGSANILPALKEANHSHHKGTVSRHR